ncbi:MAG: hypothetical protein ACREN5_07975 [Gemmatimonadales bacterium]
MAKTKRPSIPPTPGGILSAEQWAGLFNAVEAEVAKDPLHPLLVGHPEGNPIQIRPPWRPSAERWAQGVSTVGAQRWEQGIQNPRADFKAAALANNDGWKAGVTAAVQGDRFAKGLQGVSVDEAIATAMQIGGAGYAAGAQARATKFQRKVDAIAPRMAAVTEATRRMPARTDAEREARMLNQVRGAREAAKGPAGR